MLHCNIMYREHCTYILDYQYLLLTGCVGLTIIPVNRIQFDKTVYRFFIKQYTVLPRYHEY